MDDTAQSNNLPTDQAPQPIDQSIATPTPISAPQKEQTPVVNQEYIKLSEPEPTIPQEVAEAGVEKISEETVLPPDIHKLDVRLAKEATPVITEPTGAVSIPMTEEEVKKTMAVNKNLTNSFAWWLALVYKQFKKMHKKIVS